jgi:putative ABC transport system substrate-binding protein
MPTRRQLLIALGAGAAMHPFASRAQSPHVHRIGFLGNSTPTLEANLVGPFRAGLRDLGYNEGRDLVVEYRWAEGNYDRLPRLAAELAALKVEVIVTAGTPASLAVKTLAKPGGNATGLTSIAPDLEGKRLELLKEIVPSLAHAAYLWNPANPFHVTAVRELQEAAGLLHVKLLSVPVRTAADFDAGFAAIARERPEAMTVLADRVFLHNRARIVRFAATQRLPAVYAYRELVDAGGLMSFGPNYPDMHRRAATYVDRILKGTRPADLPVELPTKFELYINLKAAGALGITLPREVLLRASDLLQ